MDLKTTRLTRRHGYFCCTKCKRKWESSYVYCRTGTSDVLFKRDCKGCRTPCLPYKVEKIRCSKCGQLDCNCANSDEQRDRVENSRPPVRGAGADRATGERGGDDKYWGDFWKDDRQDDWEDDYDTNEPDDNENDYSQDGNHR